MLLLLTEKEASKKKFKDIFKVLVSSQVKEFDKRCLPMGTLMPSDELFSDFISQSIDMDGYFKGYKKLIKKNPEMMSTFVTLGISYQQNKVIALVCSAEEMQYLYAGMLAELLHMRYGIEYTSYKQFNKSKASLKEVAGELEDDNVIKLCKDAKKYQRLIFGQDIPDQFLEGVVRGDNMKPKKKLKKEKVKKKTKVKSKKKKKVNAKKSTNIVGYFDAKGKSRKKKKHTRPDKVRTMSRKESEKRIDELIGRAKKADKHPNKMIRKVRVRKVKW